MKNVTKKLLGLGFFALLCLSSFCPDLEARRRHGGWRRGHGGGYHSRGYHYGRRHDGGYAAGFALPLMFGAIAASAAASSSASSASEGNVELEIFKKDVEIASEKLNAFFQSVKNSLENIDKRTKDLEDDMNKLVAKIEKK
ncbi:MAG: hypothetical protein H6679_00205 [Epsilonproteobacteria bacterium]|nr:hypothetical protein [Campylobacterota bacterium]